MSLDEATRERIAALIDSDPVVLFMKGNRDQPQCRFSAQVVQILDRMLPEYATVDILSDPALRDGIKAYSSWPTIPQLNVRSEFLGGCEIVREIFASGELQVTLGVDIADTKAPRIHCTPAEAATLERLVAERPGQRLHLQIDARFQNHLYLGRSSPAVCR